MWSKFIDRVVEVSHIWLSWVTTKSEDIRGNGISTSQRNFPRIGSAWMHRSEASELTKHAALLPIHPYRHASSKLFSLVLGLWLVCATVCKFEVKLESTLMGNWRSKLGRPIHHHFGSIQFSWTVSSVPLFHLFFPMCFGVASWRDLSIMCHLVISSPAGTVNDGPGWWIPKLVWQHQYWLSPLFPWLHR